MSIKSVVIAGAGGSLGAPVLEELRKAFQVTILTRASSTSEFPPGIPVVKVGDDYPQDEVAKALKGHDALVSTITTMSASQQKALIDAAIEAGIKRFIPSEFSSDATNPAIVKAIPIYQEKVAIEEYLQSKESTGLSWTSISTNPLFDWVFSATKGSFLKIDVQNKTATVLDDGNHPWSTTNLHQVALGVRRVLENPEATKNKHIFIESFTTTQNQLLDALEKELDVKFERQPVDGQTYFKENAEKARAGDVPGLWNSIFAYTVLDGSFKEKTGYANGLLGLEEEDFDMSVKRAVRSLSS